MARRRQEQTAALAILTAYLCLGMACTLPAQEGRSRAQDSRQAGRSPDSEPAGGLWQVLAGDPTGPGQFQLPDSVAVDREGNLFVADTANDRIQKLSPDAEPLAQWGARGSALGQFRSPKGLAVDGQDNLFVVDTGNNRIQKLSPTGEPLAQWGTPGSATGQFRSPFAVAVDGQGNLFVADTLNHRIQKLSPAGAPLAQWGTRGSAPGQFQFPRAVAVDSQGNVFVADPGNNRIQKLSPAGAPLAQWRVRVGVSGSAPSQSLEPRGVAVDRQGNIFVADTDNDRILKLSHWGVPGALGHVRQRPWPVRPTCRHGVRRPGQPLGCRFPQQSDSEAVPHRGAPGAVGRPRQRPRPVQSILCRGGRRPG